MTSPGLPLPMLPESLTYGGDESPCVKHACRACCMDTQMPLTQADITRLTKASGKQPAQFTVQEHREPPRLANTDGHCVFLGETGCTVYAARPTGCRIYPLVLDPDLGRGVLDEECPHTKEFRIRPRDRAALMGLVKTLDLV